MMFALEHKRELSGRWGWMLASGIIDLHLGRYHFCRPARHRGLGYRAGGRNQYGIRRPGADRDGTACPRDRSAFDCLGALSGGPPCSAFDRNGSLAPRRYAPLKKHFRIAQEADTTSRFPCTSYPQEIRVPLRSARGIRIGASLEIIESATSAAIDICSSSGLRSCDSKAMRLHRLRELASPPLIRQRKSFRARGVCALASRSLLPPVSRSFRARHADLEWANLAEDRLRLDRLPATAAERLSSPAGPPSAGRGDPGRRHSSRKTRKSPACRPPLRCGPSADASGAVRSPPAGRSPSRSR
jgi:hypothetical protein